MALVWFRLSPRRWATVAAEYFDFLVMGAGVTAWEGSHDASAVVGLREGHMVGMVMPVLRQEKWIPEGIKRAARAVPGVS